MDTLFRFVETLQAGRPWGRVLDAGTGADSLGWLLGLPTTSITAVTADPERAQKLARRFRRRLRSVDRVRCGRWEDPSFLAGERFDVVLADYLLGAVDAYAPYFADRLCERLRPHVAGRLYVIGLEPEATLPDTPAAPLLRRLFRFRDAALLLAGDRPHREYPLPWALRQLRRAGFSILRARTFPIHYDLPTLEAELAAAAAKLPRIRPPYLRRALHRALLELRAEAVGARLRLGSLAFGRDYVIAAAPEPV